MNGWPPLARDDRRLGKGLAALLGENFDPEGGAGVEREVEMSSIRPNPFQPRGDFDEEGLEGLAGSIRENGLLQPIVVRPVGETFQIVAGERRFRAVQRLGWESVPVIMRGLTDEQMLVVALVENLQREDLSPLEEAHGYRQLIDRFGLTQEDVGRHVGRDRSTVTNALRLLTLPDEVQRLLARGGIAAGHARAILGLEDDRDRIEMAKRAARSGWSVRETERRVRSARSTEDTAATANGARGRGPSPPADPAVRQAELILERALGTQVRVRTRGPGGEIVVSFHDDQDFVRLLEMFAGSGAADRLR